MTAAGPDVTTNDIQSGTGRVPISSAKPKIYAEKQLKVFFDHIS
jgi:hypothetical protein